MRGHPDLSPEDGVEGRPEETDRPVLEAGTFARWVDRTIAARDERGGVDVACGACTACCRSSYFIHVGPSEEEALAAIPDSLLFEAPGLPPGHVLMGYDDEGRCPMLREDRCTIYEARPLTCRQYDCRVFPATGLEVGGEDKDSIQLQSDRWQFTSPEERDRQLQAAVQDAAAFLRAHADCFPSEFLPRNSTQLAVLAVCAHPFFLGEEDCPNPEARARAIAEEFGG